MVLPPTGSTPNQGGRGGNEKNSQVYTIFSVDKMGCTLSTEAKCQKTQQQQQQRLRMRRKEGLQVSTVRFFSLLTVVYVLTVHPSDIATLQNFLGHGSSHVAHLGNETHDTTLPHTQSITR